jgi:deoxyribonuclease-4
LEKVLKEFDRVLGRERLLLFHLNDSKAGLGSRIDRHEHIGRGKIGEALFRTLVRARRFSKIPKIIETPGGVDGGPADRRNLGLLFSFASRKG